jgi:hypothetical protein
MVVHERRRHRSLAGALCGAALTIGSAACGTVHGPAATPRSTGDAGLPVVNHVPRLVASLDLKLPLDAYLPSLREVARYGIANRELIQRCMEDLGIGVRLPKPTTGVGPRTWTDRRYGLTDATAATALGYGLGSRDPSAHPHAHEPPLAAHVLAALTGEGPGLPQGVPAGGCSGQAQRTLAGNADTGHRAVDPFLAQRLSQESFESSRDDPRVLDAFSRWSRCMLDKGHDYSDPLAPFSDPALQKGPTRKAVRTAVDDVACKRSTNLVGIWYAVESAYQTELIKSHHADLVPLALANTQTARAVAKVLDRPTSAR